MVKLLSSVHLVIINLKVQVVLNVVLLALLLFLVLI